MVELKMSGVDFGRIVRACSRAASRNDIREELRYIELRADGETCVATAIDGFVMQQLRVPCEGRGVVMLPATAKAERSERAVITAGDKLRVSFFDVAEKLIIAYEYRKFEKPFFDWSKVVKEIQRPESVIHFDAKYLRKIVMATAHADDQVFSIFQCQF